MLPVLPLIPPSISSMPALLMVRLFVPMAASPPRLIFPEPESRETLSCKLIAAKVSPASLEVDRFVWIFAGP